jgi:hypothetical protein
VSSILAHGALLKPIDKLTRSDFFPDIIGMEEHLTRLSLRGIAKISLGAAVGWALLRTHPGNQLLHSGHWVMYSSGSGSLISEMA